MSKHRFDWLVQAEKRAWIVIGLVLLLLSVASSQYNNSQRIKDNRALIEQVQELARVADQKAQRALIQQALTQERVCSLTGDQRTNCRDLFERLVRNVSAQQRKRLACTILSEVHDPALNAARRRANCPRPTPPPRNPEPES